VSEMEQMCAVSAVGRLRHGRTTTQSRGWTKLMKSQRPGEKAPTRPEITAAHVTGPPRNWRSIEGWMAYDQRAVRHGPA